jgi:hypothetical protein
MRFPVLATPVLLAALSLTQGCDSRPPTDPIAAPSAAGAPVDVSVFAEFQDINPCTGEEILLTYEGTGSLHEFGDHSVLHVLGQVTTSDGWAGSFNWTFVFQVGQVGHFAQHDVELDNGSHQRVIFAVGIVHVTAVNGEEIVTFEHFSKDRVRCVGTPA